MTLSKTIELNQEAERSLREARFYDHADAIAIGIEALKLYATMRKGSPPSSFPLLPGETKD